jgi:DNA-binding MarR family transcriptional regulator
MYALVTPNDLQLRRQFESHTLSEGAFRHRQHVQVTWGYLTEEPSERVAERMCRALLALATSQGAAQRFHHTLTVTWVWLTAGAACAHPHLAFDELVVTCPWLLDKNTPLEYYTRERLYSERARLTWVQPDRQPLPWPTGPGTTHTSMALKFIPQVHRATHRVGLHLERLKAPGVTQGEAHILAQLALAGQATIGEIYRAFAHKRSTLTSILDRLEERGLIVRESDSRDRRTFVIKLTRTGKSVARRVLAHLESFEAAVLKRATREQLDGFFAVLDALDHALDD